MEFFKVQSSTPKEPPAPARTYTSHAYGGNVRRPNLVGKRMAGKAVILLHYERLEQNIQKSCSQLPVY